MAHPGIGTLWIGDLEPFMDETFLKQVFLMMGENLMNAKVIRNKYTGSSLGYGFLEFGDEKTAQRVLHRCNGKTIPNTTPAKRLKLNHASYGKEFPQQKEYSIFVGELSYEVDDLRLFTVFSTKYSSVKSAKVVLDDEGISKGYGFIRFTSHTDQQNALVEMQNSRKVGSRPIRVSIATPKNKGQDHSTGAESPTNTISDSTAALMEKAAQALALYNQYIASNNYQAYYMQNYQQQYYGYGYDSTATANNAAYTAANPNYQYQYTGQKYGYDSTETTTEEYDIPLDIDQLNEELISRNEELYTSMDSSRWFPSDEMPLIPFN